MMPPSANEYCTGLCHSVCRADQAHAKSRFPAPTLDRDLVVEYAHAVATPPLPRPFLKWAGGKRQLLNALLARVPERHGTYHEPFIGGGALYYRVHPDRAVLSDLNDRLVRTYRTVRDEVEPLIDRLATFPNDRDFFLEMRARDIDAEGDVAIAAWMIFLNKTGFNGLYRVNKKGRFNVPFGKYKNPLICDAPNLRRCSEMLEDVDIRHADFRTVEDRAKPNDFVYFDPPYVPVSASASFTSYTRDGFTLEDQQALRDLALRLKDRGVHVLLSNASVPKVHELYADGFERIEVYAARAINCDGAKRGKVAEALIW
jgi:DNA adenine methylase